MKTIVRIIFQVVIALCTAMALPARAQVVNTILPDLYLDTNGNLHYVSPYMDAQLIGGKYAGDSTRPWFTSPIGSGINEGSSGQSPNWVCDRVDKFNGGSGTLSFCENITYVLGNGFNAKTTSYVAVGTSTFNVTANANIAAGQDVFGPGIPTGDTVQSYSGGLLTLTLATSGEIQGGTTLTFESATINTSPANSATAAQASCESYTLETSATATCVGIGGYVFRFSPGSGNIGENNLLCHDFTGRKSSTSGGGCEGAEIDVVASGPDDASSRAIVDGVFAEDSESIDGATTILDGFRARPSGPNAQNTPNPAELIHGFSATTMTQQSNGASGQYGQIDYGHICDSAGNACFAATSGSLTFQTSVTANSGQATIQFPLGTAINKGQAVSGSANIPAGVTVSSVFQCWASNALSPCGGITNATLVTLSGNITPSSIPSGSSITFTGTFPDGELFNGIFNDSFANWTNQLGTGYLKGGTLLNSGTVFDIEGFGEDSTSAQQTDYGDIQIGVMANTHGSVQGKINLVPTNHGLVQIDGVLADTAVHPGYVANDWYVPWLEPTIAGSPINPGAGTIVCSYGSIKQRLTISKLGAKISTASAGNNTQFAVYSNGSWGRPSTLLANTMSISTTNTGAINAAASVQLQPGGYWWCENADNSSVIFTSYSNAVVGPAQALIGSSNQGSIDNTANLITGVSVTQTFGTWPSNFSSGQAWTDVTTSSVPEVAFLVSSIP